MGSAIHGIPRLTQNVDFVAELKEGQVDDLVARLKASSTSIVKPFGARSAHAGLST